VLHEETGQLRAHPTHDTLQHSARDRSRMAETRTLGVPFTRARSARRAETASPISCYETSMRDARTPFFFMM
jgi:hypothetical protein